MTSEQWDKLLAVIGGELVEPMPVGFIIDSPWLAGWAGISALDYFSSERMWFEANLKAVREFPDVIFLPGFWSEFGMCTEPSAFGARSVWSENDFPHPGKIVNESADIDRIDKPHAKSDGLLPFVLKRLAHHHD
ncbi:MAG: uroporphyrinogen decarboxylase, partial [Planctomycetes bacterium]|nr:uroporphyrinogen decarboxylase [Planctomycetota bacterium]